MKILQQLTITTLSAMALGLAACQPTATVPHPPTFADFAKVDKDWLKNEKAMQRMLDLTKAMDLNAAELATVRATGNARLMVGAAAGLIESATDGRMELLRLASEKEPKNPVVLSALAEALIFTISGDSPSADAQEAQSVLEKLRGADPDNALPDYLASAMLVHLHRHEDAAQALARATKQPSLTLYEKDIRRCMVEAGDFVQYPPYTARRRALGWFDATTHFLAVQRDLLEWEKTDDAIAADCLAMGERLQSGSVTFLEEMAGCAIQRRALAKMKSADAAAQVKCIDKRRDEIAAALKLQESIETSLGEEDAVRCLNKVIAFSEMEAWKDTLQSHHSGAER